MLNWGQVGAQQSDTRMSVTDKEPVNAGSQSQWQYLSYLRTPTTDDLALLEQCVRETRGEATIGEMEGIQVHRNVITVVWWCIINTGCCTPQKQVRQVYTVRWFRLFTKTKINSALCQELEIIGAY